MERCRPLLASWSCPLELRAALLPSIRAAACLALAGAAATSCGAPLRLEVTQNDQAKASPKRGNIDIGQEMLRTRRLFLTGEVNDDNAKVLIQQLLFLEADDPTAPVTIFINSGGGHVHSGLAILDVMATVTVPLRTVACGRCFSIAAVLLAAGTPGQRFAYENVRLMIHEPSCAYPKLTASDLMIKAEELKHTRDALTKLLSSRTGRKEAEVSQAVTHDMYMSVAEAIDFGILDRVLPSGATKPGEGLV